MKNLLDILKIAIYNNHRSKKQVLLERKTKMELLAAAFILVLFLSIGTPALFTGLIIFAIIALVLGGIASLLFDD